MRPERHFTGITTTRQLGPSDRSSIAVRRDQSGAAARAVSTTGEHASLPRISRRQPISHLSDADTVRTRCGSTGLILAGQLLYEEPSAEDRHAEMQIRAP